MRGIRRTGKNGGEIGAIEPGGVAFKLCLGSVPDTPRDMSDAVFDGAARLLSGVPPVMLGDVLLEAAFDRRFTRTGCASVNAGPFPVVLP